jgi:Ser/Thr protein kinase RdoA (MazF antagonist)/tetratricopeptide (TPR) repeat protein
MVARAPGPVAGPLHRPTIAPATLGSGDDDETLELCDARLGEAELGGAQLEAVDLRRATLVQAHLVGANLRASRLCAADLALADLRGADLRGADLDGADLRGADLREARCDGASFLGASLQDAQIAGATGLAPALLLAAAASDGVPVRATRAWQLGRNAHGEGRLGLAEARYREALGWTPDSDVTRWALAASALERGTLVDAIAWLDEAVVLQPEADRARLGAIGLRLCGDARSPNDAARVSDGVAALRAAAGLSGRVGALAATALAALEGDGADVGAGNGGQPGSRPPDAWRERRLAAAQALHSALPDDPALRFAVEHLQRPAANASTPARRTSDTAARLADPAWLATELADLTDTIGRRDVEPWQLQSVLVRALTVGEMEIAARAEARLTRAMPEAHLWGTALRELDLTAEAIAALVRTRRGRLGAVKAIETESGVYYAKRYHGATRPTPSVAFTHRAMRAVAGAGVRVPQALGDASGDDVLVFGDDCLALYDEVGGVSVGDRDLNVDEAAAIGALAARIHAITTGFSGGRPSGGLRIGTRLLRALRPGAAFHHRVAQTRDAAIWYESSGLRRRLESRLDLVGRRVATLLGRLQPTLIHGDLGAGNVLLSDDVGAGAVDWDLADVDFPVFDLARAIDLGCVHWPSGDADPVEIRVDVARAMLAGYVALRPLSDVERAVLPILLAASRVELDAGLVALLASHEADAAAMLAERACKRLDRAVAGAPEIALALEL